MHKHISLLQGLSENEEFMKRAKRISIEQKVAPHFRTYIAVGEPVPDEVIAALSTLATEHAMDMNPFKAAGIVNAITFVDYDEKRPPAKN